MNHFLYCSCFAQANVPSLPGVTFETSGNAWLAVRTYLALIVVGIVVDIGLRRSCWFIRRAGRST